MLVKSDEFMKAHNFLQRVDRLRPHDITLELTDGTILAGTQQECDDWEFTGLGGKHFVLDVLLPKVVK